MRVFSNSEGRESLFPPSLPPSLLPSLPPSLLQTSAHSKTFEDDTGSRELLVAVFVSSNEGRR